ncbi:hypothetical protein EUZ85_18530 [Hahella sp. KA22]|uniref:hypothetical protein n=1 Tax=Hahella sp. KA22 TaxID=1628392 RepID=UPI000FDD8F16|nr:hypothetical protein [Hahella sp. KA22]AZZ92611.1 hypothetical protein ENC22_15955 [Hahella sp. KA22]QAY55984.1 hypothetical protein EUZ85_18530 [Hahella sp. KA22]
MDTQSQKSPRELAEEAIRRYRTEYLSDLEKWSEEEPVMLGATPTVKEQRRYKQLSLKEISRLMDQSSMEYQLKRMKSRGW